MITSIKIQVLGNNLACDGVSITRASVNAYTSALSSALSARFPTASVEIDAQWNASGSNRAPVVACDGGRSEETQALATVAEIHGQVWEQWTTSAVVS